MKTFTELFRTSLIAVGIAALITAPSATAFAEELAPASDVAIQVDDLSIAKSEFDAHVDREFRRYLQSNGQRSGAEITPQQKAIYEQIESNIAARIIARFVLLSSANDQGIAATDAEVQSRWNEIGSQFQSEAAFEEAIRQRGNSPAKLREQIHEEITIAKFIKANIDEVNVDVAEARAFYDANIAKFERPESIRARHILIQADSTAYQDILAVQAELKAGADFAQLAGLRSEGPSSTSGGDLGFFTRDKMVTPFSDAAFKLEAGEVSEPVETRFGWHIIKVEERKPAGTVPFEELEDAILNRLEEMKRRQEIEELVTRLTKTAVIKVNVAQN